MVTASDPNQQRIESETEYYMQWLHKPGQARQLESLRTQVDATKYWSVLSRGKTTEADKNQARDEVIRAAISHLLTKHGAGHLAEDDEHAVFYISLEIGTIDRSSDAIIDYETHGKSWAADAPKGRIGPGGDDTGTPGGGGPG